MPSEAYGWFATAAVAVIGALATIGAALANNSGRRENNLIEQLQEQSNTQAQQIGGLLKRERARDDYIEQLRLHISNGNPPPPPPWPDDLRR
ncbi:hypothetical protein D9V30_08395 [Mycetocola reblochoni]|uniref:Uncharacterized protein n=2 Tax=Mycetocola reblochoni TaxID=331618 RepID=A0A1R4JQL8_9MICO|nr:hypothetical protein [Mycetocola reblochoni]RLP69316.1 hypothetical protein D9V30_08395 [Mycetocola reblochoni]SJN34234.1 hypothetical protein FM119_08855 [Mycetocola reblochoni REB411]